MVLSGNIFKLKAGVIEVFANPRFTLILRNTMWQIMEDKAAKDRRFTAPKVMVIEPL